MTARTAHVHAPVSEDRVSFAAGVDVAAAVEQAVALFRRDGVVVLDDLVDPALIAQCRDEIAGRYPTFAQCDPEHDYQSQAGRHTMTMCISGLLADRRIFVPPPIVAIASELLHASMVVESLGLLVSQADAPQQKRHPDALLYPDNGMDRVLPPFALAFALPLVDMDDITGTTAFWRGSHRKPGSDLPHDLAPHVPVGSALLWDFRVEHGGLANHSGRARPVIFSVLCREWWREVVSAGATHYQKLLIDRTTYDLSDAPTRRMMQRALIIETAPAPPSVSTEGP